MKKNNNFGNFLIILGMLLIMCAAFLFLYNQNENKKSSEAIDEIVPILIEKIEHSEQPLIEEKEKLTDEFFCLLTVDRLGIKLPIYNRYSEEVLKLYPCRYTDDVLCGHNTLPQFSFLLSLKTNDIVTLEYINGESKSFGVVGKETVQPDDFDTMLNSNFDLTLFTCTYTNQERYTVRLEELKD